MEYDINYTNKSLDLLRRILAFIQNHSFYNKAHYIVAYKDSRAVEIQKLMKEFEIAPNSAVAAIQKIRIGLWVIGEQYKNKSTKEWNLSK